MEIAVHVIEVTDRAEAQRARVAQYTGIEKVLNLGGQIVLGTVRSVVQDRSVQIPKWIISIRPAAESKPFAKQAVWTQTR